MVLLPAPLIGASRLARWVAGAPGMMLALPDGMLPPNMPLPAEAELSTIGAELSG